MKEGSKYEHPLWDQIHGEFTWCLHCERAYKTKKWVKNGWDCPHMNCDGSALDAFPWEKWPRENHTEYPTIPIEGECYPLY